MELRIKFSQSFQRFYMQENKMSSGLGAGKLTVCLDHMLWAEVSCEGACTESLKQFVPLRRGNQITRP